MRINEVVRVVGLSHTSINILLKMGILVKRDGQISKESLSTLQEGEHFVVCCECNGRFIQLSQHLPKHGLDVQRYLVLYPESRVMSEVAIRHRTKTPEQRRTQSEKLKARFKTPEGQETRRQISEAAKKMQAGEYGAVAARHLRQLNAQPEQRAAAAIRSKAMWGRSSHRAKMTAWREENRDKVLSTVANARRHIHKHFTKIHAAVKEALLEAGLTGFVTEHPVGWYSVDEALVDIKLAVEVDGCWWHGCAICGHPGVGNIKHTDARKSTYLKNRGWTMLRLPEHDVKADINECINRVREAVEKLSRGAA